jgi:hypothetical protein
MLALPSKLTPSSWLPMAVLVLVAVTCLLVLTTCLL